MTFRISKFSGCIAPGGRWPLNSDLRLHPRNWHTYLQFDRIHVLQDESDCFRSQQSRRKSSCRFNPSLWRLSMAASSTTIFLNVSPISTALFLRCSSHCTSFWRFLTTFSLNLACIWAILSFSAVHSCLVSYRFASGKGGRFLHRWVCVLWMTQCHSIMP